MCSTPLVSPPPPTMFQPFFARMNLFVLLSFLEPLSRAPCGRIIGPDVQSSLKCFFFSLLVTRRRAVFSLAYPFFFVCPASAGFTSFLPPQVCLFSGFPYLFFPFFYFKFCEPFPLPPSHSLHLTRHSQTFSPTRLAPPFLFPFCTHFYPVLFSFLVGISANNDSFPPPPCCLLEFFFPPPHPKALKYCVPNYYPPS